jgi:hypothetical protein
LTARPAFYLGDCGSRHPHAGELHHELFGHVQCLGDAGDDLGDVLDLLVRVADGVDCGLDRLTASWYFEEVLRFDSSVITWRRKTTQAVEIGGVPGPADANLLLLLGSANRDPAVFGGPRTLRHPSAECQGAPLPRVRSALLPVEG